MAKVYPDGWRELEVTGAAAREIETLALLESSLPDAYTVYHSVHWTSMERGFSIYGEIDFAVMNGAGDLLLIEQKSGFLTETPDGLMKRYGERLKSVPAQISRSLQAMQTRLNARLGDGHAWLEYLFYCPDYRVSQPGTAGIEARRIVDSTRRHSLPAIIAATLPERSDQPTAEKVHRFLCDILQLEVDVSAMVGRARQMVTRLSGGLAHWARQLDFTPFRLRVTATAGSGKTQLALAEFRAAIDQGRRPLYVCYNRPLADHFAAVAPSGGLICTFHMLCDHFLRASGEAPDFSAPGAFERMVERAAAIAPTETFLFDTVIVDEGQDFSEEWRDLVLRHARPDARLIWLEDPMQNLYGRQSVSLPGWVGLRSQANYRSPRSIVNMLRSVLPTDFAIEAQSPIDSADLEILTYASTVQMLEQVKEGIKLMYSAGYRKGDVAIVTFRGRESSDLLPYDQLGPHSLKRFTGAYDAQGRPVYTGGDLLVESVYRFKGQAAPAVVLAEIDFEALDDIAVRKLFVGATRAMMKLVLVMSERAAAQLLARL